MSVTLSLKDTEHDALIVHACELGLSATEYVRQLDQRRDLLGLTPDEYIQLQVYADDHGETIAEYLRSELL